jgi:hypothetical protein
MNAPAQDMTLGETIPLQIRAVSNVSESGLIAVSPPYLRLCETALNYTVSLLFFFCFFLLFGHASVEAVPCPNVCLPSPSPPPPPILTHTHLMCGCELFSTFFSNGYMFSHL